MTRRPNRHHAQRGATLIIALIMLVALGLLAAWAAKSSTVNLRVVSNTQSRLEAFTAAQAAIETTLSAPTFSQQPAAFLNKVMPIDVDGDGIADMTATMSLPTCYRAKVIRVNELNPAEKADRDCLGSSSAVNSGIDSPTSMGAGDSICANSEWNLRAEVTDANTGAKVAVNQGVALRGLVTDTANACP